MNTDVFVDGAAQIVQPACLLQRSFTVDGGALGLGSMQRTFVLDNAALLTGDVPWEQQNGMITALQSASVAPARQLSLLFGKIACLPLPLQIMVACSIVISGMTYFALGKEKRTSAYRAMGGGLSLHIFVACISGFLRGYGLYVIGPFLAPVQRDLQLCFPCPDGLSDAALASCSCPWKEFAVSSVALGAIFGGLAGGSLSDWVGRRPTLIISDVLFLASSLMVAMSGSGWRMYMFFGGRVLAGFAVGTSGPASHAYVSELVPPCHRGKMLTLIELAVIAGVFTVLFLSASLGDQRWRLAMELPAVPAAIQLLLTACLLHESPRWLAARGQNERANAVMDALGLDCLTLQPSSTPIVTTIFVSTEQARRHSAMLGFESKQLGAARDINTEQQQQRSTSTFSLFCLRWRRVALATGCALAHNALGANIVMYYSRDIMQLASIGNSARSQISLGVAKALGTSLAFVLVDRCGRRLLLILGVAGAILGHIGLATAFLPVAGSLSTGLAWSSLLLFLASWDLGWASLMATVITEVLPDDVRGQGLGFACSLYWLVSFLQAQTLETLFKHLSIAGTFGMYAFASILSILFVVAYVPETCGRPLDTE